MSLNVLFHDFVDYMTLALTSFLFTHDFCFHELYMCFIDFECQLLSDFHVFMDIYLFYSLLEGFHTSFQDYHKTSSYSSLGSVFNYAKIIFKLIFENSFLPKGGWMGDHALYA